MTVKNAYIISLKFAPGLKKEFEVLGQNIRQEGISVRYFLSRQYEKLKDNHEGTDYITKANNTKDIVLETAKFTTGKKFMEIFSAYPPFFLCFYNPHPLNPFVARLVKKNFPEAILALCLHDPYKPDKRPYGVYKASYIALVELVQRYTVDFMDHEISPSEYSFHLFKRKFPKFKGKTHIAPLLVPDQRVLNGKKPNFFSIVGNVHEATGHDTFVELVNYVASNGLDYEFALISSSNISRYLEKLSAQGRNIVKVVNKKIINDSEINEMVRESYAVFRLDKEVTQSGVIPVAYMNQTPVVVRDIPGLRQHVDHKRTGYIVPLDCSMKNLIEAMSFVKGNFSELSTNARESYEQIWAEWNFDRYYDWLIELLKRS